MFKRVLLLVAALAFATTAGSNDYYSHTSGVPATGSLATSATMRAEFDAIKTGFDLLPSLSTNGDKSIFVNSGGTALTALDAATARSKLAVPGLAVANTFTGANSFSANGGAIRIVNNDGGVTQPTNVTSFFGTNFSNGLAEADFFNGANRGSFSAGWEWYQWTGTARPTIAKCGWAMLVP
jgi:hypothetical protein